MSIPKTKLAEIISIAATIGIITIPGYVALLDQTRGHLLERVAEIFLWYGLPISVVIVLALFGFVRFAAGPSRSLELTQTEYEEYKKRYTRHQDAIIEENRGATELAVMALRAAILLNGTSAAAILAFIGTVFADSKYNDLSNGLINALILLLTGVLSAVVATSFSYLRMYFGTVNWNIMLNTGDGHNGILIVANFMQAIAFCLVVLSYVFFTSAVIDVMRALKVAI